MKALKKWFPLISLICGALALAMIFLPIGSWQSHDYTGMQVALGDSDEYLSFSFINTLAYVLAIVGAALAFLGAKSNNKMMKFAAIGCFVLGAILFFTAKNYVQFDGIGGSYAKEIRKQLEYEIGAYLSAIFCLLDAGAAAADAFVQE
jgi:hypothetical protein